MALPRDVSRKVVLCVGVVLIVFFVALFSLGRAQRNCPTAYEQGSWSSRYVPLYSKQCPQYYQCPLKPGIGNQVMNGGISVEIVVNSECFRGPSVSAEKDAPRILFLGDSFGFGWAVVEEETYPSLVSGELSKRLGCDVEYVNLAIPGFSLEDKLESLRQKGLAYGPDVVVLQIFWDDWYDNEGSQSYIPALRWLGNAVRRIGCEKCEEWAVQLGHLNQRLYLWTHSEYSRGLQEKMGDMWREFVELSEQGEFTLVVLDLGSPPIIEAIPQDLAPGVERHMIPYFPEWESEENLLPDAGHPNTGGHRLLAEVVVEELLESRILDCVGVK